MQISENKNDFAIKEENIDWFQQCTDIDDNQPNGSTRYLSNVNSLISHFLLSEQDQSMCNFKISHKTMNNLILSSFTKENMYQLRTMKEVAINCTPKQMLSMKLEKISSNRNKSQRKIYCVNLQRATKSSSGNISIYLAINCLVLLLLLLLFFMQSQFDII